MSAAVVAGIAAWSSYRHMVTVALNVGEQPQVAYVLPLSVDGMLVVASVAMVDDRRSGRTVRWSARLAFAVGVLASLAANVSAAHPSIGARIVAAWPALALLLTVELLSRAGKPMSAAKAAAQVAAAQAAAQAAAALAAVGKDGPPAAVPAPATATTTIADGPPPPIPAVERPKVTAPPALVQSALAEASAALAAAGTPRTNGTKSANGTRVTAAARSSGGPVRTTATIKQSGPHTTEARLAAVRQRAVDRQRAAERKRVGATKARRTVAETRALAAQIEAEHPGVTQEEIAAQLGISARRLREVLTSAAAQSTAA
jgi:hypothetical protein